AHPTILSGTSVETCKANWSADGCFSMSPVGTPPTNLTAPYPIIQGETFQVQPGCDNNSDGTGAPEEAKGYSGDIGTAFASINLYNSFLGSRFIIRPWHQVSSTCQTPAVINPPFRPYSN